MVRVRVKVGLGLQLSGTGRVARVGERVYTVRLFSSNNFATSAALAGVAGSCPTFSLGRRQDRRVEGRERGWVLGEG